MYQFSANFQHALHRTAVLLATVFAIIFIWAYLRIPDGNLSIAVFAFLAAVRCSENTSVELQLKNLLGMISGTILLQTIISLTSNIQLLNTVLPAAASFVILQVLPSNSAYPVLLAGFLAYSAEPGVYAAEERIPDILIAGFTAWLINLSAGIKRHARQADPPNQTLTLQQAVCESITLLCATFLYKILSMPQGLWIVLTVIFIYIAKNPKKHSFELVRQRIFSVPVGIILGGIFSSTVVMFNYHMAYLAPLIGAVGFFMLYYRHDFFSFSLFFMFAFTVCADWLTGSYHEFNFLQLLFARSLATVIGASLLMIVEKSFSINLKKIADI